MRTPDMYTVAQDRVVTFSMIVLNNCREVLKEIRDEKLDKVNKLVSQSIVVQALWQETLVSDVKQWHRTLNKLPKNIFNFCIRYLNNTLPTLKNMFSLEEKRKCIM